MMVCLLTFYKTEQSTRPSPPWNMFMENIFMRECSTWNDKWENKKQNNVGFTEVCQGERYRTSPCRNLHRVPRPHKFLDFKHQSVFISKGISFFRKIQLLVYYQCCVLIGWATIRYICYNPLVAKAVVLKTKTMAAESRFASLSCFVLIFLTN